MVKQPDSDLAQQSVLQAVVLADSFAQAFRPVSYQVPKALMPLVNVPMIEYTLEFLAASGVQEIFVFCCAHAEQVISYVRDSQLELRLASVRLHVLAAKSPCFSAGDALREVEALGVITSDFVLCHADVVSNLELGSVIAAHKARRESDRDAVMTTVLRRVPAGSRSHRAEDATLVATSGETGRLLLYEQAGKSVSDHKLLLPTELLQETDRLQLHSDLRDPHIDVCAPELLALLQDNFDWQDLRRDLLPGILGQFEYLGKTIYTHVITDAYATRVHDPRSFDGVSRDILRRWAYPHVPDSNGLPGAAYKCGRGGVYKERGVSLARSCVVEGASALGAGSSVGERSVVRASVLGRGCCVGSGCTVEGSYLWADVRVGEGAAVRGAICCDGVVIGAGAVVPSGCLLGPGVEVPAGAVLAANSRHTALSRPELLKKAEDMDDDDSGDEADAERGADADADAAGTLWRVVAAGAMGKGGGAAAWPISGELSEPEDDEIVPEDEVVPGETFFSEVEATMQRGIEADHTVENVALEVNSLKFAQNRTFADCLQPLLLTLLSSLQLSTRTKKERPREIKRCLKRWGALLGRFVQSQADQDVLLATLISVATESDALADVFQHALHALYECDASVLSEEAILRWASAAEAAPCGSPTRALLDSAAPFLTWLQEAEEDSEED